MAAATAATNETPEATRYRRAETVWHAGWKASFAAMGCEVERPHSRITDHRADIVLPSGTVLEVQKGWLSEEEARRREASYVRMAWILDGTQLGARWWVGDHGCWIKSGCRWWATLRMPRFVDLGRDGIAQLHSLALVEHKRGRRLVGKYTQRERREFIAWAIDCL